MVQKFARITCGKNEANFCTTTRTAGPKFCGLTATHIDRLPGAQRIVVASPCSGHGFKFAPSIGDILADLAIDGATRHDIARFRLARFS